MMELINTPPSDPYIFFKSWYEDWQKQSPVEATAMILATASKSGVPSVRTVLLKEFDALGFVFYTNYLSHKASDLDGNPQAEILFYWDKLVRQVRILGDVERVSASESDEYFSSRPRGSQIGAWASEQSSRIPSRDWLADRVQEFEKKFDGQEVSRPENWGGYRLKPAKFEFWQGRPSRLHDRIFYSFIGGLWQRGRLSP